MPVSPHVGLLPLYLALYDESLPTLRGEMAAFLDQVRAALEAPGLDVTCAPVCCVRSEVESALGLLSELQVDAMVTLHLAYSPSLEAADALAGASTPLILLDTTPDAAFSRDVDPGRLLYNHGIHGVQDLAAVLRRRGRRYAVVAGHLSDPSVAGRVAELARAALAVRRFRSTRALRVGSVFAGMGDFQVPEPVLERLGIEVDQIEAEALLPAAAAVTDDEIRAEGDSDRAAYEVDCPREVHERSLRVGLGLRHVLEQSGHTAFSMNFQAFDFADGPLCTVPFLECSKAMARSVGYAGEGDVLTAALVGALETAFGATSFTEMFCPDWQGGTVFLSHMGEFNPALAAGRARIYEKPYAFGRALNPAAIACAPKPGPATLVNLSPGPDDTFRLIAAPVEILEDGTHLAARDWLRAWIRPRLPLARFLERYSELGGTHHSALMLGHHVTALLAFAAGLGFEGCVIDE